MSAAMQRQQQQPPAKRTSFYTGVSCTAAAWWAAYVWTNHANILADTANKLGTQSINLGTRHPPTRLLCEGQALLHTSVETDTPVVPSTACHPLDAFAPFAN
jgi:hypothetical protein